jgi:hypothetical protein
VRGELYKSFFRLLAAGRGIRHDTHTMPQRRLGACKIKHVAKEAADGRAQHMQDAKARVRHQSTLIHASLIICASATRQEHNAEHLKNRATQMPALNAASTIIVWNWLTSRA